MITALIIDDKKIHRDRLTDLLTKHSDIEVIQQCASGEEGISAIALHHPQLIFLDVEMPRMSGLEMLEKIKDRNFDVIFTTAFEEYSIAAFRLAALDYLVKKITQEELDTALDKFRNKHNKEMRLKQYELLLENIKQVENKNKKIVIKYKEQMQFIPIGSIVFCESSGGSTDFYFTDRKHENALMPLKHYQEVLSPFGFKRIHNEYIVNPDRIEKAIRNDGLELVVKYYPDKEAQIPVSRTHRAEFEDDLII